MNHYLKHTLLGIILFGSISPAFSAANPTESVQLYIQAWSEKNVEKRKQLLSQSVSDDISHPNAPFPIQTRAELNRYIQQIQGQVDDLRADIVGNVILNKDTALFNWRIKDGSGALIAHGVDAVEFAKDGRLKRIDGFFDVNVE